MATRLLQQPMFKSLNFSASTDKVDCGTDFIGTGDVTVCGWIKVKGAGLGTSTPRIFNNGKFDFGLNGTSTLRISSDGATYVSSASNLPIRKWNFISLTRTSAGIVNFYINGILSGSANQSSGTPESATTTVYMGCLSSSQALNGLLKNIQVYNRILTTTEQDGIYLKGINPSDYGTSIVRDFTFENDTGVTVYSKNNISQIGTITGATFSSDVPVKQRKTLGNNLAENGSIDRYSGANPQVATTTSGRWIDGTAVGSTSNNYGWRMSPSGSASAMFDTTTKYSKDASLKLSTTAITSFVEARGNGVTSNNGKEGLIIKPNTSYTMRVVMKTNKVSGDSTGGAFVSFLSSTITGAPTTETVLMTGVTTTTDWTVYEKTFTTASNAWYGHLECRIYGHTGTGTLIMDAWFDDISLVETTAPTRSTASNRVAVRDCGTALRFDGSGDYVNTPTKSTFRLNATSQDLSVSTWFRTNGVIVDDSRLFSKEGSNDDVRLRVSTSGNTMRLIFTIDPNAGSPTFSDLTGSVFQPNTWYNVVATYSRTDGLAIYMNGVLANSNTVVFTGTTGDAADVKWTIGGSNVGSLSFKGVLDEPRIWSRALSAQEISNLYYNNIVPRDGLVGEWLFNEASGSTALDTSGNDNNGTITGATYTTETPLKIRTQS